MDSIIVVGPVTMVSEPSVFEYVSLIATIVLAFAALYSLKLTRKQVKDTNQALSDSARTNEAERFSISEEHKLRLKQIMPWFQLAPPSNYGYADQLGFNNEGARANDISIELILFEVDEANTQRGKPSGLKPSKTTVQAGGRLSIKAEGENLAFGLMSIVKSEFRLVFYDDLGNRYCQNVFFGGRLATHETPEERTINITRPSPYLMH